MTRSEALFAQAQYTIPGGVNSPVRCSVGGTPRFIARAQGAYMVDADGNRLIDYVGSCDQWWRTRASSRGGSGTSGGSQRFITAHH